MLEHGIEEQFPAVKTRISCSSRGTRRKPKETRHKARSHWHRFLLSLEGKERGDTCSGKRRTTAKEGRHGCATMRKRKRASDEKLVSRSHKWRSAGIPAETSSPLFSPRSLPHRLSSSKLARSQRVHNVKRAQRRQVYARTRNSMVTAPRVSRGETWITHNCTSCYPPFTCTPLSCLVPRTKTSANCSPETRFIGTNFGPVIVWITICRSDDSDVLLEDRSKVSFGDDPENSGKRQPWRASPLT